MAEETSPPLGPDRASCPVRKTATDSESMDGEEKEQKQSRAVTGRGLNHSMMSRGALCQCTSPMPDTLSAWPVMNVASSDRRKATAEATSFVVPRRFQPLAVTKPDLNTSTVRPS